MRSVGRLAIVSCALFACYARSKELEREPCSAPDVLRLIGTALVSGDASSLRPVVLHADDLFRRTTSSPEREQQREEFDSESLQEVTVAIKAVAPRYKSARVQRVEAGEIDRRVVVEGMDIIADRMRDAKIVFERSGQETTFTVAGLISTNGCWKVEHLGTGVAAPTHAASHARSLRPSEGTGFRPFADDFCTGLSIYSVPSRDSKIGSLVEGYRKYRDRKTNRVYEAVLLQSLATGHVRGVWLNFEQLANAYVDRSDHALQDCKWSTREQEVMPLPEETPAAVPRQVE